MQGDILLIKSRKGKGNVSSVKRVGTKTPKCRPVKSLFVCVQCVVALCKEV